MNTVTQARALASKRMTGEQAIAVLQDVLKSIEDTAFYTYCSVDLDAVISDMQHDLDAFSTPAHCHTCNGSGEGMYDGTRCQNCRGKGELPSPEQETKLELDIARREYNEER